MPQSHGNMEINVTAKRVRGQLNGSPRTDSLLIFLWDIGTRDASVSLYRDTGHNAINNHPVFGDEGRLTNEDYWWRIRQGRKLYLLATVPENRLKEHKIIKVIPLGKANGFGKRGKLGPESYIIYDSRRPFGIGQEVFKRYDFFNYYLKDRRGENQVDLDMSHSGPTP